MHLFRRQRTQSASRYLLICVASILLAVLAVNVHLIGASTTYNNKHDAETAFRSDLASGHVTRPSDRRGAEGSHTGAYVSELTRSEALSRVDSEARIGYNIIPKKVSPSIKATINSVKSSSIEERMDAIKRMNNHIAAKRAPHHNILLYPNSVLEDDVLSLSFIDPTDRRTARTKFRSTILMVFDVEDLTIEPDTYMPPLSESGSSSEESSTSSDSSISYTETSDGGHSDGGHSDGGHSDGGHSGGGRTNTLLIVGIIVAVVLVLIAICVSWYVWRRRRQHKAAECEQDQEYCNQPTTKVVSSSKSSAGAGSSGNVDSIQEGTRRNDANNNSQLNSPSGSQQNSRPLNIADNTWSDYYNMMAHVNLIENERQSTH